MFTDIYYLVWYSYQNSLERTKKNNKLGEAKTLEEFVTREIVENSAPNAQRLFEVMELGDHHLVNEDTFKGLYEQIESLFD